MSQHLVSKNICFACFTALSISSVARGDLLFSSSEIVEEIVSSSPNPYAFDWRAASLELSLGYDYIDEANNFENDGAHFMVGFPAGDDIVLRFGLRRYWVFTTKSSDLMGRTPFKQSARSNRYEIAFEAGYVLFQGRTISPLSPTVADGEHTLQLTGGAHFAHENAGNIPAKSDVPEPMPGQEKVHSRFVIEGGLRWQYYFPTSLGLFFAVNRQIPLGNTGSLVHWTHFTAGTSWSFGVK